MIDAAVLRARLEAIAALHEWQASQSMKDRDPRMAAAADNARLGVVEALAVVDAMVGGLERGEAPPG